jgi:quercetin dioxygenase-like cupin family protein
MASERLLDHATLDGTAAVSRRAVLRAGMALGAMGTAAFAFPRFVFGFHYPADIPITSVGGATTTGTLVEATTIDILSTDAFTRSIHQGKGTQAVLTRNHFNDQQSTGWHTHPGPNIVMIASGGLWLLDDSCNATRYGPGQGFSTGLGVHEAIADGATEFYSFYFLPADATELRMPLAATDTSLNPRCAV